MKKIILLQVFVIVLIGNLYAQEVDDNKDYIYTKYNEIKYANKVTYKTPFLATSYFLADSVKYKKGDVKFYKNTTGFYANTFFYPGLSGGGFAERVSKGKINLFKKEVTSYAPMGSGIPMGGGLSMGVGMPMTSVIQYYNVGFGPLKKAKYKNLVIDLADNAGSMEILKKYKKKRDTATGFFVGGGVLFIAGVVSLFKKTYMIGDAPQPKLTTQYVLMGGGAGVMLIGSGISFSLSDLVVDAMEEYNK